MVTLPGCCVTLSLLSIAATSELGFCETRLEAIVENLSTDLQEFLRFFLLSTDLQEFLSLSTFTDLQESVSLSTFTDLQDFVRLCSVLSTCLQNMGSDAHI